MGMNYRSAEFEVSTDIAIIVNQTNLARPDLVPVSDMATSDCIPWVIGNGFKNIRHSVVTYAKMVDPSGFGCLTMQIA